MTVFTPPPKDKEPAVKESDKDKADYFSPKDGKGTSESSFEGLSQSSSFVEVSGGDAEEDADGEEDGGEEEDGEPGDDDDDGDSFLSESFDSGSEAPPDDDDGEDDSRSPSPSNVPLPPSRSPSSTPSAEVPPKIKVSKSPAPEEEEEEEEEDSDSSEGRLSTIREESTTPPGSPEKNPSPPSKTPLAAPVPVAASPLGLGLGRPSTRPTRSSPLANAPVSGDEEDKTVKHEQQAALKPRPASPKPVFGALSPQLKTESIEENPVPAAKPPRPKTPPLSALSFGFPAPKAPLNAGKGPLAGAPLPVPSLSSPVTPGSATPTSVGLFGFPTPKSVPAPTTPVQAPKGFFGMQPAASSSKPSTPAPAPPPPEATMEEGMQKECALLFASMTRELEDVSLLLVRLDSYL